MAENGHGDDREKRENGPFWTFQILDSVCSCCVEGVSGACV